MTYPVISMVGLGAAKSRKDANANRRMAKSDFRSTGARKANNALVRSRRQRRSWGRICTELKSSVIGMVVLPGVEVEPGVSCHSSRCLLKPTLAQLLQRARSLSRASQKEFVPAELSLPRPN